MESLARPGGNITGSAVLFPEVTAKQMELIKEAHDKTSRILVIGNWSNPAIQRIWNSLPPPAQRLNVRLEAVDIRAQRTISTRYSRLPCVSDPTLFLS